MKGCRSWDAAILSEWVTHHRTEWVVSHGASNGYRLLSLRAASPAARARNDSWLFSGLLSIDQRRRSLQINIPIG